jgi:hypothetical protein
MATPIDVAAELWAELAKGDVVEAFVTDAVDHVDGLYSFETNTVYVNPAVNTVLTLLHELMHRRWPQWSERKVARESKAVLGRMSDAEVRRWHRAYQKAKRIHKRTVRAK